MRTQGPGCLHTPRRSGPIEVVACAGCARFAWYEDGRPIDPDLGVARLFGAYDLVGSLPAVNAPGDEVLLYRPARPGDRRALAAFEPRTWFRVTEHLWLCHDRALLMLSSTSPLVLRNLGA